MWECLSLQVRYTFLYFGGGGGGGGERLDAPDFEKDLYPLRLPIALILCWLPEWIICT